MRDPRCSGPLFQIALFQIALFQIALFQIAASARYRPR
jgi:hypothetical protein